MSKPLAEEFAAKGKAYLDEPYDEIDCQALVEAMLRDVGVKKNWKGSNAMYRDMAWVGTPEECKKQFGCIPVGAFIFILKHDGGEPAEYRNDGIGNADHVGVKTGTGKGAIHSSATMDMVAESSFKDRTIPNGGWNRIGLCRLVDYGRDIECALYGSAEDEVQNETVLEEVVVYMTIATVVTSGGTLNIRDIPSTKGDKLGIIANGETVEVLEKTDPKWWKIQYNGISGYCSVDYLKENEMVEIKLERSAAFALCRALNEVFVD